MRDHMSTIELTDRPFAFRNWRGMAVVWIFVVGFAFLTSGNLVVAQESNVEPLLWNLTLTSGKDVPVTDWSIDDGQVQTKVADRPTSFPFEQILKLSRSNKPTSTTAHQLDVRLTDGSELHCLELVSQDREIVVSLACGKSAGFRRSDVTWFRKVDASGNRLHESEWNARLESPSADNDALGLLREQHWRWVEGRLGAIEPDQVEFAVEDKSAFVKRDRFEGVLFATINTLENSNRVATVLLTDGSRFNASKLQTRGNEIALENLRGAQFQFTSDVVDQIDFSNDRWVWLSDLQPTTLDWRPLFGSESIAEKLRVLNLPRFNQSYSGKPLQINVPITTGLLDSQETKTFTHGIAMRGGSRVAFSLDKKYRLLQAAIGFEPSLSVGNVRVRILGDGRSLFDEALAAKPDALPVNLDVEVSGVERLLIEVDYHDGRATGDLIHFCDPKVSK